MWIMFILQIMLATLNLAFFVQGINLVGATNIVVAIYLWSAIQEKKNVSRTTNTIRQSRFRK